MCNLGDIGKENKTPCSLALRLQAFPPSRTFFSLAITHLLNGPFPLLYHTSHPFPGSGLLLCSLVGLTLPGKQPPDSFGGRTGSCGTVRTDWHLVATSCYCSRMRA